MFKLRIHSRNSIRINNKKIYIKNPPKRIIKAKIPRRKWFSISMFFFIFTLGTIVLFLISINSYLRIIAVYSITGFLTFFVTYFGWVLANFVINKITTDNNQKNENNIFDYFKKLKKIIISKN